MAEARDSTVAMDGSSGGYGSVSASWVPLSSLQRVYASVPGQGAVLTQSYLVEGDASQALALRLLGEGALAADVIAAMTDPQFDMDFSLRQYVVIDASGKVAGFSGTGAQTFAGHLDASDDSFSVGTAGNILTGAGVLEAAALGFHDPRACDLEERLLNALEASSVNGLGDARCVENGRPAQSAWLHVEGSNGEADLDIAVDAAPGTDPTLEVIDRFAEWRSTHPCPADPEPPNKRASAGCRMAPGGSVTGHWVWLLALLGRRRRSQAVSIAGAPERARASLLGENVVEGGGREDAFCPAGELRVGGSVDPSQ